MATNQPKHGRPPSPKLKADEQTLSLPEEEEMQANPAALAEDVELIPPPLVVRAALAKAEKDAAHLRRLLCLSIERHVTPEMIAAGKAASSKGGRHAR